MVQGQYTDSLREGKTEMHFYLNDKSKTYPETLQWGELMKTSVQYKLFDMLFHDQLTLLFERANSYTDTASSGV